MDNKTVTQADEDAADALYNLVSDCQDKYEDWQLAFARHRIAERERCAQPTQSDALLEGDTQTILYLLGVRHGREDERAKIAAEASQPTQSDDEAYDLGKRDGYEKAVQDIDMLTGGDGEYCYSTIEGERHCPNVDTMKARIARRLRQPTQGDALRDQLLQESLVKLRDVRGTEAPKQYACNLIKRIERVLQEQSK